MSHLLPSASTSPEWVLGGLTHLQVALSTPGRVLGAGAEESGLITGPWSNPSEGLRLLREYPHVPGNVTLNSKQKIPWQVKRKTVEGRKGLFPTFWTRDPHFHLARSSQITDHSWPYDRKWKKTQKNKEELESIGKLMSDGAVTRVQRLKWLNFILLQMDQIYSFQRCFICFWLRSNTSIVKYSDRRRHWRWEQKATFKEVA